MALKLKQIEGFEQLYIETSQSREELYYTDNFGSTIQLTYSGSIGGQNLTPSSGSEIDTGYTFDGYPVYRQFFSGSAIPQDYVLKSEIRDVVGCAGWIQYDLATNERQIIPFEYTTLIYFLVRVLDNNDLVATRGTNCDQKDYRFFVEYTKL